MNKTTLADPQKATPTVDKVAASDAQTEHEASMRGWRAWLSVLQFAVHHAAVKNLTQVAASLTYITILAIVPMLAVVLSLFTAFPIFAQFQTELEAFFSNNLMPPAVSENVMDYLNLFAAKASGLTTIGSIFLVVMSIRVIMTIDITLNNIWNVKKQRPLRQRLLVYWAIVTLGPILAGASLWTTSLLAEYSLSGMGRLTAQLHWGLSVVPVLISGVAFSALFLMVPNRHVFWRDALAGGFLTALILAAMKFGFAYYLKHFPSYTIIYGAFATIPIFLLWVYMSWLGVLSGATLAAILPALRLKRWLFVRYKAASFVDALLVLQNLREVQNHASPGSSEPQLTQLLKVPLDELYSVLADLQSLGYIVHTQDTGGERWVLACNPAAIPLSELLNRLVLDREQPGLANHPRLLKLIARAIDGAEHVNLGQALDEITADHRNNVTTVTKDSADTIQTAMYKAK